MIEVNLLGLIGLVVVLLTHTVSIVTVVVKHGNRIDNMEQWKTTFETKSLPSQMSQLKEGALLEARARQLECTLINGKNIEAIRDEIREVKDMIKTHLTIHETENKRRIYKSKQENL